MKADIIAMGEILIDFTSFKNRSGKASFEQNAGGAPVNVLAALSKLGLKTSFIGCIGKDQFGAFLKKFLYTCNIDDTYLKVHDQVNTTLAFVHLEGNGERDFSFYRKPGADQMISTYDIDNVNFEDVKVFHFGSLSLTDEPSRSATLLGIKKAKENRCYISYDPNYREPLWSSTKKAKEQILSVMDQVDILKISEEELFFLTGLDDLNEGIAYFSNRFNIPLVIVTLGENGCAIRFKSQTTKIDGFKVKAIDTTGAGDSFLGAMLYHIINAEVLDEITVNQMKGYARFANHMAAYVTTKQGSAEIMPDYGMVMELMKADIGNTEDEKENYL